MSDAKPDMNKKAEIDRGEMDMRVEEIYVSPDTQRDGDTRTRTHETEDTDPHYVPGDQRSVNRTIKEKEELQIRNKNLTKERDHLQEKLSVFGWRYFGSSFYFLSAEQKTWYESRQDCQMREADLVIINSEEERRFLSGLQMRFWIGLTDKDEEETWKWVDGTELTTGFWEPRQPDNYQGQEDCAEMNFGGNKPLEAWNDLNCRRLSREEVQTGPKVSPSLSNILL
ncbi:C-type lectin domain family 4 member K-like isoform X4 [Esox lucius]|uniref:C-type lectin domain family 4 member K-like isoform X4 n=1 Tax=Esox lucius TaxID=8010 RepID=UPI0014773BC8|nr:C-type lectin domain family 4 member K-like isoform X4 [Esox lucius]